MKAFLLNHTDAYSSVICNYFNKQFPKVVTPNKTELVDILSEIMVGTKDLRFGPIPSPEILVNIRAVIRDAVEKNLPIPLLVPWGGRKLDAYSPIDVAEVSGIQQIIRQDTLIKDFYQPGMQINVRIEDINALWLYRGQQDVDVNVENYSNSMVNLIYLLEGDTDITPVKESTMMNADEYYATCRNYSTLLSNLIYIQEQNPEIDVTSTQTYQQLAELGWKGTVPKEQRDYYLGRYESLYNCDHETAVKYLADYFAGSKARYDLNAKGVPISEVKGFIQANFAHPVPNAPSGIFDTTVFWRTVPMSMGRTHAAPWRAKGYLQIEGNNVTTKVTSWHDGEKLSTLTPSIVRLTDELSALEVKIGADYVIKS